jgi:SSS family solute:Na+ symporter
LISLAANRVTFCIVGFYLLAMVLVGYFFRKRSGTASQFLHAEKMLPTAVTSIAFLAANCGALEIVGLAAASAKYGALALHFYWIGAIPAMLFLALFMMPVYAQSKARTLPEFLRLRYNQPTQMLNAISMILMMGLISGISLYAIASLLQIFLGWSFPATIALSSMTILVYVSLGGLKSTIYNEIIQLGVTIAGLIPLSYFVLHQFHGINGLLKSLPENMRHVWTVMPLIAPGSTPLDVFGVVVGLGFVLSFGYWCTDFMLIQRALATRSVRGSMNTPLFAGIAKLFFPLLVIVPGLAASLVLPHGTSFDEALPAMMLQYYGPALVGIGIAAILASLMSALAGNIMAISTIWTHDLYRTYLVKSKNDAHYVLAGRLATVGAACFALISAYIAIRYNTIMDYLQLVFSLFNAPLLAALLLGVFTTWATPGAAFWGMASGMVISISNNFAFRFGLLRYGSQMSASFYGAIWAFLTCLVIMLLLSMCTQPKALDDLDGLTYKTRRSDLVRPSSASWMLAILLLVACVWLNLLFR